MAKTELDRVGDIRRGALERINQEFEVVESVQQLRHMMKQVTAEKFDASTVNAACACMSQINNTIKTAIQAAKFLSNQ